MVMKKVWSLFKWSLIGFCQPFKCKELFGELAIGQKVAFMSSKMVFLHLRVDKLFSSGHKEVNNQLLEIFNGHEGVEFPEIMVLFPLGLVI